MKLGREPTLVEKEEAELYCNMIDKSVQASSMGRVLDAVSCILGICCKRTYEGEPAIKLERWLEAGKPSTKFYVEFGMRHGLEFAKTLQMFDQLLDLKVETDSKKANAAVSFVRILVQGLAERACDYAVENHLRQVGLSGGVSYSGPITAWVKEVVEKRELEFVGHQRISNGDGGISTGQNAIAGALLG